MGEEKNEEGRDEIEREKRVNEVKRRRGGGEGWEERGGERKKGKERGEGRRNKERRIKEKRGKEEKRSGEEIEEEEK